VNNFTAYFALFRDMVQFALFQGKVPLFSAVDNGEPLKSVLQNLVSRS